MAISQDLLIVKYHVGIYGQWITLANVSNSDRIISGWKIREYASKTKVGTTFTFPSGTVIKAKSLLIVMKEGGSGINGAPATIPVVHASALGQLGRDGEKIILLRPNDQQVDELIFSSSSTKYSGKTPFQIDGFLYENEAFERISITDTDKVGDWIKVTPPTTPIIAWGWAPLDNIPPTQESHSPTNGATNVLINELVKVTFNEPILAGPFLQSVTIKDANNVSVGGIEASVSGKVLTIAHSPFDNNKIYTVNVPVQAVIDAAGNGNTSAIGWSFTTIAMQLTGTPNLAKITFDKSTTAFPQVAGLDGAVEANALVKIYSSVTKENFLGGTFATATGSFVTKISDVALSLQAVYVTATAPGKAESAITPVSASVTGVDKVLIVKYHSGSYGQWITLANITDHDINLTNWKMSEYVNFDLVGSTWTIPNGTVIKAQSLLIVKRVDGSGITGVPADIPVVQTSLSPILPFGQDHEKIILQNPSNIQVDELNFWTMFNGVCIWHSGLTLYQICIPPSEALTNVDGFERKSVIDTNTEADWKIVRSPNNPIKAWEWVPNTNPDTTPPVVLSTEPANGAANVTLDAVLKVTFNEPIMLGTEEPTIYSYYEGRFISPQKLQASVSGNELLIAHTAFWSGDWCDVIVPVHTVTDLAGNSFTDSIYWSFTTGVFPPTNTPDLSKIIFDNSTPSSATVTGLDGAVEPNAEVTVYGLGLQFLGVTIATATGSFQLTIDTTIYSEPFELYAVAPGKAHSAPVNLQ
ncbi:Ig-like domain-containing protein [Peribacillus alkalitolerans]|uniref:Ig-like domain-containing protein n=1 Tax=Peribacillus alkalitolerans TaxID=1550385 RepID=UPI0013D287C6|nr:Ig-like domain-containing protein [Peribacillus alkalitolerans]